MSGRAFVDTNVLVYCYDSDEPDKRARALEVLAGSEPDLVLSTQVLQEFYVAATRRLARPVDPETAARAVGKLAELPVVQIDARMVVAAIATSRRHRLSLWDSLILRAALEAGCERVLTEDLQHGFELDGLRVENPFA
ncbi:MAG: PIN domain-containing protein [Myxococcota bacterium]